MTKFYIETAEDSPGLLTFQPPAGGGFVVPPKGNDQVSSMPGCHGMLGWKEFLENREDLLRAMDRAIGVNSSRPIKTEHGPPFEAAIRKWLTEFLPRRYAVTSGFIIPNIRDVGDKLYHYDVIIYDALDAPVLWASSDDDHSSQGRHRAIPAKHVLAVYEVKASLTRTSAKEAAKKLGELAPLAQHLPGRFSSGVVFGQLVGEGDVRSLGDLLTDAPGYWGGAILRASCDQTVTGMLVKQLTVQGQVDGPTSERLVVPINDLDIRKEVNGEGIVIGRGAGVTFKQVAPNTYATTKRYPVHYAAGGIQMSLSWSRSGFAEFAAQVLNQFEGIPFFSDQSEAAMFAEVFDRIE